MRSGHKKRSRTICCRLSIGTARHQSLFQVSKRGQDHVDFISLLSACCPFWSVVLCVVSICLVLEHVFFFLRKSQRYRIVYFEDVPQSALSALSRICCWSNCQRPVGRQFENKPKLDEVKWNEASVNRILAGYVLAEGPFVVVLGRSFQIVVFFLFACFWEGNSYLFSHSCPFLSLPFCLATFWRAWHQLDGQLGFIPTWYEFGLAISIRIHKLVHMRVW